MKDFGLKKIWEKFVFHFISRNFKILVSENVDFPGRQAGRKISMSESQRPPIGKRENSNFFVLL